MKILFITAAKTSRNRDKYLGPVLCVILSLFLTYSCRSLAAEAVGWHWYNEPLVVKEKKKEIKKQKEPQTKLDEMLTAMRRVQNIHVLLTAARSLALENPTPENMRNYFILQNYIMDKSSDFTRAWKRTMLMYPELDYTVAHPTENNAQHVMYAQEDTQEQQAINKLRQNYGLLFFYRGNNQIDQELAPAISGFAHDNNIALIPVAVDGKTLAIFPSSRVGEKEAKQLHIKYFPALILVNPKNGTTKPLNYGFIARDELRKRFLQVGTDFNKGF